MNQPLISEIEADIRDTEINHALYEELNFSARTDAIDFIDFHVVDRIEGLLQQVEQSGELHKLKQYAEKVRNELEQINAGLFKQLRENIKQGIYRNGSFKKMVDAHLGYNVGDLTRNGGVGYDNLDLFINGLLSEQAAPEATVQRESEMVFYQKIPARIIFELSELAKMNKDDVFFDLGSGLGQAVMLINLICGCKAYGVEYEPAYNDYAQTQASQLNLADVAFMNADAREADYSTGTVFFMYTPFNGDILYEVLQLLKNESKTRPVRIFTCGPCSYAVGMEKWLNCLNGSGEDIDKLYEFVSM
ncbi:hypothetical protein ACFGVR_06570 [Mucilaginibacter sp. AW1-3]